MNPVLLASSVGRPRRASGPPIVVSVREYGRTAIGGREAMMRGERERHKEICDPRGAERSWRDQRRWIYIDDAAIVEAG